ncbi:MAG: PAS domain S-box protein [Halobacteriota archaeon]
MNIARNTSTTILLIEDSPTDVRLIQELLRSTSHDSFHVITASTLSQGLTLLSTNTIDVILLDLGLPDSQGIATFRAVYEHASHLPIIILTVSDDEALGREAVQEGAQRFLSKDILTLGTSYAGLFTRTIRYAIEHKRAETALAQSELQYRQLVDTANVIILRADPQLTITYCNDYTLKLLGYTAEEFIGQPVVGTLLPPTESTGRDLAQMARDVLDHPERYEHNRNEVLAKDGRRLWIEWTNAPEYDEAGNYTGVLSTGIDVTEHVAAEEALKRSKEQFQNLFNSSAVAQVYYDTTGCPVRANHATLALFGIADVRALQHMTIFSSPRMSDDDKARLRAGQPLQYEHTYDFDAIKASGSFATTNSGKRHFHVFFTPLFDTETRSIGGYLCQITDMTERKRADNLLQEAHEKVQALNEELRFANETLERRVHERTEELTRELAITETITRLTPPLLFPSLDFDALMLAILDDAKRLTGSTYGFIALIDPRTKDLIAYGHTQMMLDECAIPEAQRQIRFPIGPDGKYHALSTHAINEKKGFFTNTPAEHPASTGAPDGHVPIRQFLAVPALVSDEVAGEIALANPERDYTRRDVAVVGRLAEELFSLAVMRMRAEEQLRASSLYARSLIESSLDPLVTISAEGTITDVNKATEEVTGFSRNALIGSDFSDYFTEPDKARKGYQQVFADGFVRDFPLIIRHKSGKVTDVLYNASVYQNDAGEIQGVFAAARDVTEVKQAEEAAKTHAQHAETLSRIISAGNRAASIESSLSAMVDTAIELLDLDAGAIFVRYDDTMALQYSRGYTAEQRAWSRHIPVTQRRVARIMDGIPWISDDYQADVSPEVKTMNKDVGSMATVPLVAGEAVVGFYQLGSLKRQHHFTGEERDLLTSIGQETGAVVARLQAEEATRAHAHRASTLTHIITAGNQADNLQTAAQVILDAAMELMQATHASIYLLNEAEGMVELQYARGFSDAVLDASRRIPLATSYYPQVYEGTPIFLDDYAKEGTEQFRGLIPELHVMGIIPLVAQNRVVGNYIVSSASTRPFTDEERSMLVAIGQQAGTVIARLQAEERVKQYSRSLEDLITERTTQLAQSEEEFRTLFEASSIAQIRYDADGHALRMNKAAAVLFGVHDVSDIHNRNMFSSVQAAQEDKERLREGHPLHCEQIYDFRAIKESGLYPTTRSDMRNFDLYVLPLTSTAGATVEGYLAQIVDITELKEAEAALKNSERLAGIGETAAMIGHDLRNPLQGLQYIVDLQKLRFDRFSDHDRRSRDWEQEAQLFNRISEQIFYMDKIVGDLQDYARPLNPEREALSVRVLIDDVLKSLPHADKVEVNADLPDLSIEAEPHLMHRVFSNLILNALQAMPDGGTLTISATAADGSVAIAVRDTGIGVPREMRDKLFSSLTTGKAKGTGLGLAVVKRIVDAHDGTIWFESEEGKGTVFILTLPIHH